MNDDDSSETDPQMIESLMYLVNTRLNSCYAMNVLSHSMSQPRQTQWTAAKLLEYRGWCARFTIDDTLVTQPQVEASLRAP